MDLKMGSNNIELVSLLLVILVFFLDKIHQEYLEFIRLSTPSTAQKIERQEWHSKKMSIFFKILCSIVFEIVIITVYSSVVIDVFLNYKFSLKHPDINCSLSVLFYFSVISLLIYSVSLIIKVIKKR